MSQAGFFVDVSVRDLGVFNVLKEDEGDDISTMVYVLPVLFVAGCRLRCSTLTVVFFFPWTDVISCFYRIVVSVVAHYAGDI